MPLSDTLLSTQYRSEVTLIEMAGYRGHRYWQRKGRRLILQVQCQCVIGWSMAKRFMQHRGFKENINADGDSWSETSYSRFHQQLILAITLIDRFKHAYPQISCCLHNCWTWPIQESFGNMTTINPSRSNSNQSKSILLLVASRVRSAVTNFVAGRR